MRIDERLTGTRSGRYVWGGLTLVCALGLVFALRAERTALRDEVAAARGRTQQYASTVVHGTVTTPSLASTDLEFRFRDMLVAAQAAVFTDPTVARMRLWDVDGVLRFSSDLPRAEIGTLRVRDQPQIAAALEGRSAFTLTTEPFTQATTGRKGEPTKLLQTYVPLTVPDRIEPLGAVQVDYLHETLVATAREPWLPVQVATVGLTALFALLFVVSLMRRRTAPMIEPAPPAAPDAVAPSATVTVSSADQRPVAMRPVGELEAAGQQLMRAEGTYRDGETLVTDDASATSTGEASATSTGEALATSTNDVPSTTGDRSDHASEPVDAAGDVEARSDRASDLRARLARTAARKMLDPNIKG